MAGIYSSNIGFGLGATVADINNDGWQDIYVSNDFFERDYLYLNNHDGTFTEALEQCVHEISLNAMGADIADINNDGLPDIYVTDMLPEEEGRLKTKTTFENWDKYQSGLDNGYYRQFVRNVLQLNTGFTGTGNTKSVQFSEIGRLAGVYATDWSWGALIADFDNDGFKDIFVANGIYKDITDQDYIQYANDAYADIRQQIIDKKKDVLKKLIDLIPSHAVSNYAFSNNGDLTFTNKAKEWGLSEPGFSNGAAYGDLDGDGDLDLVVNNVNMPCFVYRNNSVQQHPENRYLSVGLQGTGGNSYGIGARVSVYYGGTCAMQEAMPMRGFESTVDNRLLFGLGKTAHIDSVVVAWSGGAKSVLTDVVPGSRIVVRQSEAALPGASHLQVAFGQPAAPGVPVTLFSEAAGAGIGFAHRENTYSDFDRDRLVFQMLSTQGPHIARGDVNGDGLDDLYIGGASGQPGVLYVQEGSSGHFTASASAVLAADSLCEDVDALFFDADGDGDVDLFVCSGGSEFSPNSTLLISRLYFNDGRGSFTKSGQVLPSPLYFESASCVRAADYDQDGDADLFVGVRLRPMQYGMACKSYVLQNDGQGTFSDVTAQVAPALLQAGMVSDAQWLDYDGDGKEDLAVAGEYMPLRLFRNNGQGQLEEKTAAAGLQHSSGWWNRIAVADVNADGYPDIIGANHGLNSRFKATPARPVSMYVGDFGGDGRTQQLITTYNGDSAYPVLLLHDLVAVLPSLKKKYLKYAYYKNQTIHDILSPAQLQAAVRLQAAMLQSSVFINGGDGTYSIRALPAAAQLSPMYAIAAGDYDGDGKLDVLMGGNFYQSKPEAGIYDASYGTLLKGDGRGGFVALPAQHSGIHIQGAIRDMVTISTKEKRYLLVAKNNGNTTLMEY